MKTKEETMLKTGLAGMFLVTMLAFSILLFMYKLDEHAAHVVSRDAGQYVTTSFDESVSRRTEIATAGNFR